MTIDPIATETAEGYPVRSSWASVRSRLRSDWRPGEHYSIIATTGGGKSYLATRGLLPLWRYSLILDVKGGDATLDSSGHRRIPGYPSKIDLLSNDATRFRINPGTYSRSTRAVFDDVFRKVWASAKGRGDGTWTLYADETRLLADPKYLGLGQHLDSVWISGRSRGISLIAGTQAPRWVPSAFYEQPTYFAIGPVRDRRALRRLSEISGDTDMLEDVVPRLRRYEFLFLGPSWATISKVEAATKIDARTRSPRRASLRHERRASGL